MALAGQVAVGSITVGQSRGLAEVAVGSGSVSGDLNADIADSAVGAYSLLVREAPPQDGDAALARLRATFPTLAEVNLQQQSVQRGGYVFYATRSNPKVKLGKGVEVTVEVQAILAGTSAEGRSTVVWAVVGNGALASMVGSGRQAGPGLKPRGGKHSARSTTPSQRVCTTPS